MRLLNEQKGAEESYADLLAEKEDLDRNYQANMAGIDQQRQELVQSKSYFERVVKAGCDLNRPTPSYQPHPLWSNVVVGICGVIVILQLFGLTTNPIVWFVVGCLAFLLGYDKGGKFIGGIASFGIFFLYSLFETISWLDWVSFIVVPVGIAVMTWLRHRNKVAEVKRTNQAIQAEHEIRCAQDVANAKAGLEAHPRAIMELSEQERELSRQWQQEQDEVVARLEDLQSHYNHLEEAANTCRQQIPFKRVHDDADALAEVIEEVEEGYVDTIQQAMQRLRDRKDNRENSQQVGQAVSFSAQDIKRNLRAGFQGVSNQVGKYQKDNEAFQQEATTAIHRVNQRAARAESMAFHASSKADVANAKADQAMATSEEALDISHEAYNKATDAQNVAWAARARADWATDTANRAKEDAARAAAAATAAAYSAAENSK